jgi:hypothetical protein
MIIEELWYIIKKYLIHDIKSQGKHLKEDKNIRKYNEIIKSLPKKEIPALGPRIYFDTKKDIKMVKYIYKIYIKKNIYKLIVENLKLPIDYKDNYKLYDEEIRNNYYKKK